jgi:2-aminoadipate transaminase
MVSSIQLDLNSDIPLYRQLYDKIRQLIVSRKLVRGERLPATRELAGMLGLNRTTVSAAYALLETEGLVEGHVGRGSFVLGQPERFSEPGLNWEQLLAPPEAPAPQPPAGDGLISFASSSPAEDLFPVEAFRASCEEVLRGKDASGILQLGSPAGYPPLRHYLLDEARREGVARASDDLIVTNGCQQALDLISRVLVRPGDTVAVEDPVYPGLKNLFLRAGTQLAGVPLGAEGLDLEALDRVLARTRPRLLATTPNFQNPTGVTLPAAARRAVLQATRAAGCVMVENDTYGDLRYTGEAAPPIKRVDSTGDTVLLRSFSKLTFPGLRVGWVIGPKAFIARLAEAKQLADLHTDQLSQAALLRFVESGRLKEHHERVLASGAERLAAVLDACARCLPAGSTFTRPEGGMNLWVRLPEPLDSGELLAAAHRRGVTYVPGRYFEVSRREPGGLRLCFAGLAPERIRAGLEILGSIFSAELARARLERYEPAQALV